MNAEERLKKYIDRIPLVIESTCCTWEGFNDLYKHINQPDRNMLGRVWKHREGFMVTTFDGEIEEVTSALRKAVLQENVVKEIAKYLVDPKSHDRYNLVFPLSDLGLKGHGFIRTKDGVAPIQCDIAVVGVAHDSDIDNMDFCFATAFPSLNSKYER